MERTPFGYFRPLTLATYWLELKLWGPNPAAFHLTNLLLISATAALVVLVLRRHDVDATLASAAGLLFALHPYHVEVAAWVAARGDALFATLCLLAALEFRRWRRRARGFPIVALILFEAALLAKEAAVSLVPVLPLLALCDRRVRPSRAEWLRGHLLMVGVALVHFLLLRPSVLGGVALSPLAGIGWSWAKKPMMFSAAALIPVHIEVIEHWPELWVGIAALGGAVLVLGAWIASRRMPRLALGGVLAFVALVGPALISFQERYFFLPSAATALALASVLTALGPRLGRAVSCLLVMGWLLALAGHWTSWREAAVASDRLMQDLVEASRRPGVREVVVANLPHRVRGAPVTGDLTAAVALSGGRRVIVRPATYIDYPTAKADALDGPPDAAVRRPPPFAEVRLRIVGGIYSRYAWPRRPTGAGSLTRDPATILFDEDGVIRIRISPHPDGGRAAYFWRDGRLEVLF